jgi:hypothetical protein
MSFYLNKQVKCAAKIKRRKDVHGICKDKMRLLKGSG